MTHGKKITRGPLAALAAGGILAAGGAAAFTPGSPVQELVAPQVPVTVSVDDKATTLTVPQGSTVEDTLTHAGVTTTPRDQVTPARGQEVPSGGVVAVTTVRSHDALRVVPVSFTRATAKVPVVCGPTAVKSVAALAKTPKTKVTQAGRPGKVSETWRTTFKKGVKVSETKVKAQVTTPAVSQVSAPCLLPVVQGSLKKITPPPVAPTPASSGTSTATSRLKKAETPAPLTPTVLKSALASLELGTTAPGATTPSQSRPPASTSGGRTASSQSLPPASTFGGGTKEQWMAAAGIPKSDWRYVDYIVSRESEWNPSAVNSSSGACGLVQALPCSKLGSSWSNPVHALKWQYKYVNERYGGYSGARSFWVANRWY